MQGPVEKGWHGFTNTTLALLHPLTADQDQGPVEQAGQDGCTRDSQAPAAPSGQGHSSQGVSIRTAQHIQDLLCVGCVCVCVYVCVCVLAAVMSDSFQPHGPWHTKLLRLWDLPYLFFWADPDTESPSQWV